MTTGPEVILFSARGHLIQSSAFEILKHFLFEIWRVFFLVPFRHLRGKFVSKIWIVDPEAEKIVANTGETKEVGSK